MSADHCRALLYSLISSLEAAASSSTGRAVLSSECLQEPLVLELLLVAAWLHAAAQALLVRLAAGASALLHLPLLSSPGLQL